MSNRCGLALAGVLCAVLVVPCVSAAPPAGPQAPLASVLAPRHLEGEVLIKFRPNVAAKTIAAFRSQWGATVVDRYRTGAERWRLAAGRTEGDAIGSLRQDPAVLYVEPNYVVSLDRTPNDPRYGDLYGLHNTGQLGGVPGADIDAELAWDVTTGSPSVVVAVIDTGVDYTHPDLAANIRSNPGEIAGNGIDDDGNGYVDDVRGWDFVNHDNDPMDDHSHGTHVSGTIAAVGDNALGVAGVAWSVKILPLKFLDAGGYGSNADAIAAIEYATAAHVDIMSNSWGGGGYSQAMLDAITAASDAGILFVAAAGNDGLDNDIYPHYPSSYDAPNVVAVAATDRDDTLAWFSNYGLQTVDLAAPGVDTLSCVPYGGYGYKSGTSMATPHVSGVAALVRSIAPDVDVIALKQRLLTSAEPLPALAGRMVSGGRLNAFLALGTPDDVPPSAVTDLAIAESASDGFVMSWTAPGDDGASGTATSYDMRWSEQAIDEGNFASATHVANTPHPSPAGHPESFTITGLAPEHTYFIALEAKDEWGNAGPLSNVVSAVTLPPPVFAWSPEALSADLLTGGTATRTIVLQNVGPGTLDFTIDDPSNSWIPWLSAGPLSGRIVSGGSAEVIARADATGLDGNDYEAWLHIQTNDPGHAEVWIPFDLHVTGAPDLALTGPELVLSSTRAYTTDGATTDHTLTIGTPPVGDGTLELAVNGDYGDASETATAFVEGRTWGSVGATGSDCTSTSATFPVPAPDLATFAADGQVHVQVVNSSSVNLCPVNAHTVTLRYHGSLAQLAFGSMFVGSSASKEIGIVNRGTADLHVSSISADHPDVTVSPTELVLPAHASATVVVTFLPTTVETLAATLTVASDDPDQPVATLAVTGASVDPPIIGVAPEAFTVTLDERTQQTEPLVVSNSGASPLSFTILPRSVSGLAGILDEGTFQSLAPSPVPLTCVVADGEADVVYAQQNEGTGFFRYRAAADHWESLATCPVHSGNNGGAALLGGKIYTVYTETSAMGVYDIASGQWTTRQSPLSTANIASDGVGVLYLAAGTTFVRFDPATGTVTPLAPPPFSFERWGALVWASGRVYGHQGNGYTSFAVYDVATDHWTPLDATPSGAILGAARDPIDGSYYAVGSYGGNALYRYDVDSGAWTSRSIPYFSVDDGGLAWLSSPSPGVLIVQGQSGTGFARFVPRSPLLTVTPETGTVAPGGSFPVDVRFDAQGEPGTYAFALRIASNDPVRPSIDVPATMTIVGRPDIAVAGGTHTVESTVAYQSNSAVTEHALVVDAPPSGGATLDLIAEGDYGDVSETATASAEGMTIGAVGGVGADCSNAVGSFPIGATDFARLAADGVVHVEVTNSANVDLFCSPNAHVVRLTWRDASDLDFGLVFLGVSRTRTLSIENQGSVALHVTSISVTDPSVTASAASVDIPPHGRTEVSFVFLPTAVMTLDGTVSIVSDDPDEGLVTLPVRGAGVEPPVIAIEPDSLHATLDEGSTGVQSLIVSNSGGSPLDFSVGVRGGPGAAITGPLGMLATGAFQRLASSPAPLTAVVADDASGAVFAQRNYGNEFYRYHAASDTWETLASSPVTAVDNSAAAILNGKVYTVNGNSSVMGVYDIATGQWSTRVNPLPYSTYLASDGSSYLYLASGINFVRMNPVSQGVETLPAAPFAFQYKGGLAWAGGRIYGHRGSGTRDFAVYDVAGASWARLASLPATGAVLGAAVDPFTHDYYAVGGYGGNNLYRYDVASDTWSTYAIPYFTVSDTGLAWVSGPVRGVLVAEGENGVRFARFAPGGDPVTVDPASGSVPPGGSVDLAVRFSAAGGSPGSYPFVVQIASNDPVRPDVEVPATLDVIGRPDIAIEGEEEIVTSVETFAVYSAVTQHALSVPEPPAGPATLELVAEGDYGDFGETASATAEGIALGSVGATGADCSAATGSFSISAPNFAQLAADGVVHVSVQNSGSVDLFCATQRHTVRLKWRAPGDRLDFGTVFIGGSRTRSLAVENRGSLPLHVISVTTAEPSVTASQSAFEVPAHGAVTVAFTFTPTEVRGVTGTIVLESDDPDEPVTTVALLGDGAVAPDIDLSPTSFSESLLSGNAVTRTLTVANVGGSPLTWAAAIREGGSSRRALLIEDRDPGSGREPDRMAMTAQGIPFDVVRSSDLPGINYSSYALVLIAGEQMSGFYTALASEKPRLDAYVAAGGRLEYHASSYYTSTSAYVLPGGVTTSYMTDYYNYVQLPAHPLATGLPATVYGSPVSIERFASLPANADRVMNDETGTPTLIAYPYGRGIVVATGQEVEPYYGMSGSIGVVIDNALAWLWNRAPTWLRVTPTSGSVAAGDHADLAVTIDAGGMLGGDYDAALELTGNDPDEGTLTVPVQLHVTGVPRISVAPASLDFGTTFVGFPGTLGLTVRNVGTDVLHVGPITSDHPAFTANSGHLDLAIGQEVQLLVTFAPPAAGLHNGSLSLPSDDPDTATVVIPLTGVGLDAPDIDVAPLELHESLHGGEQVTRPVVISNLGGSDLTWEIRSIRAPAATVRAATELIPAPATTAVRPDGYRARTVTPVRAPSGRALIVEDYYPWGRLANEHILAANAIPYDVVTTSGLAGVNLANYRLILVASDQTTSGYQTIAGQMSRLTSFVTNGGTLEFHAAGWGWNGGEASRVTLPRGIRIQYHDAGFNHVTAPGHPIMHGVPEPFLGTSASHAHFLDVPGDVTVLATDDTGVANLIEYRVGAGWVVAAAQTLEFAYDYGQGGAAILANMIPYDFGKSPDWLGATPLAGTIAAGGSATVDVTFDGAHVAPGDYAATISFLSNDPDEAETRVAASLHVIGIPDITVIPSSLAFGTVYLSHPRALSLRVSNPGTEPLHVSSVAPADPSIAVDATSFVVPTGGSRDLTVTWNPAAAGPIASSLTIVSDDPQTPSLTVPIGGTALIAPEIQVAPSSLGVSLLTGQTASRSLTIDNHGGSDLTWTATALIPQSGNRVLLLQDYSPWGTSSNQAILQSTGIAYDVFGSNALASLDLGVYRLIIIASEQPYWFYENLAASAEALDAFVQAGGCLEVHASSYGGDAYAYTLPGGTTVFFELSSANYVALPHPFVAGVPATFFGNSASHSAFASLPPGAVVITTNQNGHPTLVEYRHGRGTVVASGQTLEYYYAYGGSSVGTILANMIPYDVARQAAWLAVDPPSGTVPAGGQAVLTVSFDAARLNGGVYEGSIDIQSNDPDRTTLSIPVQMSVTGVPDVAVSPGSLDFGTVFTGQSSTLELTVRNDGTDLLHVGPIAIDDAAFSFAPGTVSVPSGGSVIVAVTFAPTTSGAHTVSLRLPTDDPDEPLVSVPVTALGATPADIAVTPASISEHVIGAQVIHRALSVSNRGGVPLHWSARAMVAAPPSAPAPAGGPRGGDEGAGPGLSRPADYIPRVSQSIRSVGSRALILQDYQPWYSSANQQILFSLGVAYDVMPTSALATVDLAPYGLVIVASDQPSFSYLNLAAGMSRLDTWVRDGGVLEFHAAAWSWNNGNASVVTLPGGTGILPSNSSTMRILVPGHPIVDGLTDPLIVTDASLSILHSLPPNATVIGTDGILRPTLVEYAWGGGLVIASCQTLEFYWDHGSEIGRLLSNMTAYAFHLGPEWLSVAPAAGTVPPGGTVDLDVTIDASALPDGDHDGRVQLSSDDPDTPVLDVPVHVHVQGVPRIEVTPSSIGFGPVFVGHAGTQALTITNVGTEPLHVASVVADTPDVTVAPSSVTLAPSQAADIALTLVPSHAGALSAMLTVGSDDPELPALQVPLTGAGVDPPHAALEPTAVEVTMLGGETVTASVTATNTGASDLTWVLGESFVPMATPRPTAGVSSVRPPASFFPGQTAPSRSASANVLLVQDNPPWTTAVNEQLLTFRGLPFDVANTVQLATLDLSGYRLIIVAGDQSSFAYQRIAANMPAIQSWVAAGGVLEFHAAGWGWNGGDASQVTLPGGVGILPRFSSVTHVLIENHLLLYGLYEPIGGSFPSHAYFTHLPPNAEAVAGDDLYHPNLIDYDYGSGHVVASGHALEISYVHGEPGGAILVNMSAWSTRKALAWLQVPVSSGTLPAGAAEALDLILDGTRVQPGDYAKTLFFTSNDPDRPEIPVSVTLHLLRILAEAGSDRAIECAAGVGTTILDASGSRHVDGPEAITRFAWSEGGAALGEGAQLPVTLPLGHHAVGLRVEDATGAWDDDGVAVDVVDTAPPVGAITFPMPGACYGPASLPVVVRDSFADACQAVLRTYDPPGASSFTTHGDHAVALTAADPSGHAAAPASVAFTIDTVPPVVSFVPHAVPITLTQIVPFASLFTSGDADGASGGVVHETLSVDGCLVYDGSTYGDRDGLLIDESGSSASVLCDIGRACGRRRWSDPVVTVTATDCAGNRTTASETIAGNYLASACAATAGLTVAKATGTSSVSWSLLAGASSYQLVRGELSTLRSSGGSFQSSTSQCVAPSATAPPVTDAATPQAGSGFWYLVRDVTDGVKGSWDELGGGQVASRDPGIAASGATCP